MSKVVPSTGYSHTDSTHATACHTTHSCWQMHVDSTHTENYSQGTGLGSSTNCMQLHARKRERLKAAALVLQLLAQAALAGATLILLL